jgi:hypothetical protein
VHNPSGPEEFACLRLSNLDALIKKFAAGEAVNMPDPQARRFQFKITLEEALQLYRQNPVASKWEAIDALAQFTALLEGVIFGVLKIRLYDLGDFGFQSSPERRILGVLVDDQGNVYGGTDPETLFFPAPESWNGPQGVLRQLANTNAGVRNTRAGETARALLRKFFDTFSHQERPPWLRAIDEYSQLYQPPSQVDQANLRDAWKQVGPVELRLNDRTVDARYIPVYESDFLKKATYALSGSFIQRDHEIYLEIQAAQGNRRVGIIHYPRAVSGLTARMFGAGQVVILPANNAGPGNQPTRINYDELYQYCQALVIEMRPDAASVMANPFRYPDVIRLAFEHDGFLAEYFLNNKKVNEELGERFIDSVRGQGVNKSPLNGQQPGDHYITDGSIVYVETYQQKTIRELSLLGKALWMIFVGDATEVIGRNIFNDRQGNVVLEFNGRRFIPGPKVDLQPPDQRNYAADLRGLVHYINRQDTDQLFKEATRCWLGYLGLQPAAANCERYPQEIASKRWWKPIP